MKDWLDAFIMSRDRSSLEGVIVVSEQDQGRGAMSDGPVTLTSGVKTTHPLVACVMLTLQALFDEQPIAFYELVTRCRQPDHALRGGSAAVLERSGLLDCGTVPDAVREIVLAAVDGDALTLRLASPVQCLTP
jgi:hypothetical protein